MPALTVEQRVHLRAQVEERNSDQDSVSSGLSTMGVAESRLTSLSQPKLIGNTIQRGTREHRQTRQASALAESPGESVGPKKETESLFNHWPPYNDSVRAVEMPTITPPSPLRIETPIQQRHNSLEDVLPEPSRDPVLTHGNLERFEDLRKKATNTKWMRDARRQLWDED
ncbi:uncharacterized protein NECHADRAFT_88856 [Fusarium vanettenii 77-13-4]|uniref:Uncharacterized protein n=1 Tax=Fusarium vanettenii (strain ATCC MYA-4622 / CBS 123669 / FGSC 9596 / NRRL 45880 / 77-13-4) TaxID=660122 RepID=C7ZN40_FUSV7|nr:uncharacterized protein NECHADRAFT_88856 [Fusarium vanettenii 77-13-4]EEU34555.1 predicted protein [Fusarium vanettenii 77-13-4]